LFYTWGQKFAREGKECACLARKQVLFVATPPPFFSVSKISFFPFFDWTILLAEY